MCIRDRANVMENTAAVYYDHAGVKHTVDLTGVDFAMSVSYTHLDVYKRQILCKMVQCNKSVSKGLWM